MGMADSVVVPKLSNGLTITPLQVNENLEYEKLLRLHDEIVAGTHPRLKLPAKTSSIVTPPSTKLPPTSVPQLPTGFTPKASVPIPKVAALSKPAPNPSLPTNKFIPKNANARQISSSGKGSSGLDPIFLTKSEDLVRAEMRLERQRIERSLEEQVHQRKLSAKQRTFDQEAVPDFDVSEVLFQAQDLVKPLAANEDIGANRTASSSDSFDDNTFYSSQMNESATEEADEYPKRRGTRPCRFFFEGACKKGDACTFSHDPAFKQKLQRNGSLTMDVDNLDVSRHASPKFRERPCDGATTGVFSRPSPTYTNRVEDLGGQSNDPIPVPQSVVRKNTLQTHRVVPRNIDDEMDYSPPRAQNLRNGRSVYNEMQTGPASNHNGAYSPVKHSRHRGVQRHENQTSASPPNTNSNVRVVRNHITSPIAPQPARVSPLAVAKAPRLTQLQHADQRNGTPRVVGKLDHALNCPNTTIPPVSSRKRRRDPDPREAARNVTTRRYLDSPGPYIKEEPVSPPPFTDVPTIGPPQRRPVGREPLIIESTSPQYGEQIVYQPRKVIQNPRTDLSELQGRSTPITRRVVSRAGHQYQFQDEPDLRRVVTTRQPMRNQSPLQDFAVPRVGPQYQLREEPDLRRVASARHPVRYQSPLQEVAQYPIPQPRPARAMSHSYIIQPETDSAKQYRASVQPLPATYLRHDRSPSPQPLHDPYSTSREIVPMAPPPRRIVMDQYGNKYYETPLPIERRTSVAPATRYVNDVTSPYEQSASRKPSTRAQVVEAYEGQGYIQRYASPAPTSPRYVEYYPAVEPARAESRQRIYKPAEDVVRMIDYPDDRLPVRYEEVVRPREMISRMQSVQPIGREYEVVRERAPRIQSIRPDHQRIVSLGNQQEIEQEYSRQVSVRAEERYARAPSYATLERPRYQYVSEMNNGRFVEDELQEEMVMEAPRSADRRPMQRL